MTKRISELPEYAAIPAAADLFEMYNESSDLHERVQAKDMLFPAHGASVMDPDTSVGHLGIPGAYSLGVATFTFSVGDQVYLFPLIVARPIRITEVHCICTSGASGANVRAGLYNADFDFEALGLEGDFGTMSLGTTGHKSITGMTVDLDPGFYYSAAALNTVTSPSVQASRSALLNPAGNLLNGSASSVGWVNGLQYFSTGSGSALPATLGTPSHQSSTNSPGCNHPLFFRYQAI